MTTVLPVKVVADMLNNSGDNFDALLPLTIAIENGMLTLGTHGGPDLWRGEIKDLTNLKGEADERH